MTAWRSTSALLGLGAGIALLVGCSSSGDGSTVRSSPPSQTSHEIAGHATAGEEPTAHAEVAPAPSAASSPSHAVDPSSCSVAQLRLSIGPSSGAAGSIGFPIVFTNISQRSCGLDGYPGVSYTDAPGGEPIGAPAVRQGDTSGVVHLAPGQEASALVMAVNVLNYPPDRCDPVPVSGLRIYPPNSYDSAFVPRKGTACSRATPGSTQLKVGPVVAGTSGQ